MMPLYDQGLTLIMSSLAIRAIANDKDLNLQPRKHTFIKKIANMIRGL